MQVLYIYIYIYARSRRSACSFSTARFPTCRYLSSFMWIQAVHASEQFTIAIITIGGSSSWSRACSSPTARFRACRDVPPGACEDRLNASKHFTIIIRIDAPSSSACARSSPYMLNTRNEATNRVFYQFVSLLCEYSHLEYERIHVIHRDNQADYVIRVPVGVPQEHVNICSTRRLITDRKSSNMQVWRHSVKRGRLCSSTTVHATTKKKEGMVTRSPCFVSLLSPFVSCLCSVGDRPVARGPRYFCVHLSPFCRPFNFTPYTFPPIFARSLSLSLLTFCFVFVLYRRSSRCSRASLFLCSSLSLLG